MDTNDLWETLITNKIYFIFPYFCNTNEIISTKVMIARTILKGERAHNYRVSLFTTNAKQFNKFGPPKMKRFNLMNDNDLLNIFCNIYLHFTSYTTNIALILSSPSSSILFAENST